MTLAGAGRPSAGAPAPAAEIREAPVGARIPWPQWSVDTTYFWRGGADGVLRILRCASCARFAHPPTPSCRACGHEGLGPAPVSGRATVFSYTVNRQRFIPWLEVPYVLAIVALAEQDDVHLTTRLVDVEPEDVWIGMEVGVVFEHHGRDDGAGGADDVYLPLFSPRAVRHG
ncbi:Zn-ribbon domain-containing OB-fold protein [Parafrankia elaeagni]|uniref:Zn-ribbon domain-containing OB-fold protein n=1 Tax=Parafrankia elaeagni TaxID=222534 RepID=UPI00038041B6|nr:OB-fold domain-containing protein [Parafrankia elaeagni]